MEKREKQLATLKSAIAVLSNDINASISSLDGKRYEIVFLVLYLSVISLIIFSLFMKLSATS